MLYNELIAIPILATKLYIPPPLPKVVVRTRLIERQMPIPHLLHRSGMVFWSFPEFTIPKKVHNRL
jgi:hypothetical protein